MADEFFSEIEQVAANKNAGASGDASHYSIPVYEWFGNDAQYNFPSSITAELGSANDPRYYATHNTDIITQNPIFSTFEGGDDEKGFQIKKTSASNVHSAIVEIRGGTGHWMPAPIFRTLSFYWKNYNNANANYRVYTPGLTLRNWKTNAQQRWTVGWENAADPNPSGKIFKVSGLNKAEQVNALGPDWIIYGVWFYLVSNSTSANQTARSTLLDLRFGWHNPIGGSGSYKMVIPAKMSWDDYRAMKQQGEVKFSVLSDQQPSRYADKAVWGFRYIGYPVCREIDVWSVDENKDKFSVCKNGSDTDYIFRPYYNANGDAYPGTPYSGDPKLWIMVNDDISTLREYDVIGRGQSSSSNYIRFKLDGGPTEFQEGDWLHAFSSDPRL